MAFEAVLSQVPFFSQLSPSSLSDLSGQLHRRHYERDQTIFHKNDSGSSLYIIISGMVKIILPSAEGENVIVALLSTGDFFGELSLFDKEPRSATAEAAQTAEILTLDQLDFIRYITENPKVAISILAELSLRLRRTDELLSDAAFCNLPTRLAKRLLELSENYGQPNPSGQIKINFKLKQQDLADMVGSTRESVNKTLKSLKERSVISIQKGFITILAPDLLRRRAR